MSNISVEFSLDELASVYFMTNIGILSAIRERQAKNSEEYNNADFNLKNAIIDFRESCNPETLVPSLQKMYEKLIEASPKPEDSGESKTE